MRTLHTATVFTALLLAFPVAGHAFTLADAWLAALNYSADHSAARHERNADREKKNQARAELLPQITANTEYSRQPPSLSSTTRSNGWNVQASQTLFDKSLFARYKQGKVAAETADAKLANSQGELLYNVAQAYFDVLLQQDKLKAVREERAAYTKQLERAQEMFKQGAATILDTHEAQSGYDTAVAKEVDILTKLRIAKNTLSDMTGLDSEQISAVRINPENIDLLAHTQEQEWQDLAEQNNQEWQMQRLAVKDAEAAYKAAKGGHWPKLTLNSSYQNYNNTYNYYGYDQSYRSKGATVSLNLSLPLFSGGSVYSQAKEAAERELQNRDLLTAAERKVRLSVKQSFFNTDSSHAQMIAQQRLLAANTAKLESTQIGRQVGVRNNLEEIQAQQAKADAEQKLAEAKYGYVKSYLELLKNSGVLVEVRRLSAVNDALYPQVSSVAPDKP
ncbi:TolC family outer membrane protein [Neisseria chenwenguii]|uniref:Type I secretion protein TolC n=1 Tax=Neisseria chenwenguii TaxID=1853278 RepID=A0A220S1M8_9NEIS|nr:TolC family outer membrane protein [Neisseria chenwenguii]ASK27268.1 type I secretion protein TolC [Neisseria chenwenguii]ROV57057.1 type I secretion protein TolC [Neisseria chenwenguii]